MLCGSPNTWMGPYFHWGSLIDIFKNSFCTPPHDKIYPFLGLANDHFDNPIPVDCGNSLYEVYQDAVEFYCTAPALERTDKSIELVHYTALVRHLAIQLPKSERSVLNELDDEPVQS